MQFKRSAIIRTRVHEEGLPPGLASIFAVDGFILERVTIVFFGGENGDSLNIFEN